MQTTIRNLPVPSAEIGRIVPSRPIGEERYEHRQAASIEGRRPEATAVAPDRLTRTARPWEEPQHLPRSAGSIPSDPFDARYFRGQRFSRESLLNSASFQAQHLGQVPPYENEALLRVTASAAYRQAGSLSVQYLGGFAPIDIRV